MKNRILIIEDDPNIRLGLVEVLRGEGFQVDVCDRGDRSLEAVEKLRPDLLLLDVMLPGMSGFDVCKELRTRKIPTLVLMLTAKGQEMDKVIGLELGADDYVTKPFGLRELLARIHALLRRNRPLQDAQPEAFQIGPCRIDPATFTLTDKSGDGQRSETLTARELKLLQFFHSHAGQVLSRDRLLNEVWGYEYYGTTRTLDQVVVQLRKKLGDNGGEPRWLLTVHGVGYRLASS